jgi:toxin CptA
MAERLSLRLGPSRLMVAVLGGAHLVAAAALWLAAVPLVYALVCSVALAVHLAWVVRRDALRADSHALIEMDVNDDGSVFACTRAGVRREYRVSGSSFVSPLLAVLNLRIEGRRWTRHILIAADSVDAESFRRLRVWLRWRWRDEAEDGGLAQPPMPPER